MSRAPLPANEALRLQSLRELDILDTAPEDEFDALAKAAALVCGVPVCLISLVDADRQWFKANVGLPGTRQTPREQAFCAHAILDKSILEVPDASLDPRFLDNPLVTCAPNIRFYAGAPLRLRSGESVGALCVIDWEPRQLDARQRDVLAQLALAASRALEGRRALAAERRLLDAQAQAGALLRQSEARFRALSDASPLGVFAADAQGSCSYANAQCQAIFGLTPAQSMGKGWMEAIFPQDRQAVRQALQRTAASGGQFEQEFRLLQPNGSLRYVHVKACPVLGPEHAAGSLVGTVQDITVQEMHNQALRESQALLDRTGRMAGVGGWTLDLCSGVPAWTDETCRIHGVAPGHRATLQEAIGFYAPEARPVIQATVEHAMASGQGWDLELPLVQAGGRRIWIRSVGSVEFSGGAPVRLIGAIQDVTDSRAQRQAMAHARERIEAATQSGEIGIWEYDALSGELIWDAQMYRFYGLAPSEKTGQYTLWTRHLHPDDRAATEQAFADALAGLRPYATRFRIVWNDGSVRHLRATGRVTRDDTGRALRMVGVNWDVSNVRELALELERKEQMLRSVADSLPMLVSYIDTGQRYRFANQAYAAWHDKPMQEILGHRVDDVVGAATWARAQPHLQAALQGQASVHENQLSLRGRQCHLRVQFLPQRGAHGQVEGVVAVVSDISEYKAIEQRLAQAVEQAVEELRQTNSALVRRNLDLQQFAFVASHDLRSPLRSVKGYLTLLQARHAASLDARGLDLIARATRALGEMDRLTQDLLSYARLDAPALALEPVDCNELLAHVLGRMQASMAETGAEVTAAPLPTVAAERGQLIQLLQNLLGNAFKYCQGRAPRVQVSARRGAAEWLFEVADNGIGIEPQHLDRIFEIFKRLHTAEEYPGTGIGLAICERIVTRHGGRLGVRSELGHGSTFFFSIPDKNKTP